MHAIWLSLAIPPMLFLFFCVPTLRLRSIWLACLSISFVALALWIGFAVAGMATQSVQFEFIRKITYQLLLATDFPFVALFLGSLLNVGLAFLLPFRKEPKDKTPVDDTPE